MLAIVLAKPRFNGVQVLFCTFILFLLALWIVPQYSKYKY